MGLAWGQILLRKGVSGGKHRLNHEANDILCKENTDLISNYHSDLSIDNVL
jgi:hypothetical protein